MKFVPFKDFFTKYRDQKWLSRREFMRMYENLKSKIGGLQSETEIYFGMKFILFDIEATCWDGYHSNAIQEIIELGAISVNRYGEIVDIFDQMIRPVINPRLSHYCRNLTGISQYGIDDAPVFTEVYPDFEEWANADVDTWFVACGSFDQNILNAECMRNFDESSMIQNYLDLRAAYTTMKALPPRTGLAKALEYEEMEFEGAQHRALPDTENMHRVFSRYFDYWDIS